MWNVKQLKGNKLAAVLGIAEICQLFYLAAKSDNKLYLIWFLMRIPKPGLPFLPFVY
jgi:hypothetical protein